ncbi:MAG: hypothetical protein WAO02_09410 [Verrucomicrobiia bacterium]
MTLNKFAKVLAGAILVTGVLVQARAEDKKVDPTGTYVWTVPARNGGPDRTNTLVLKLEGDKLTGKLTSPGRDGQTTSADVNDGKITGADISFSVVRTFNDNTFTNKYSGTFADGAIKGKMDFVRNGEAQSRDWEAKPKK